MILFFFRYFMDVFLVFLFKRNFGYDNKLRWSENSLDLELKSKGFWIFGCFVLLGGLSFFKVF